MPIPNPPPPPATGAEVHFDLDETGMALIAGLIAAELRVGDVVALAGDLGAGKTTLARAILRAALGDPAAEVPSPTFALAQHYDTARGAIGHFDLYRLADAADLAEIGLDDAIAHGAVLVEWPERIGWRIGVAPASPADRLDIALGEIEGGERRRLTCHGHGSWRARLARLAAIRAFIATSGCGTASVRPLPGDASTRRYLRLVAPDNGALAAASSTSPATAMLMDAPRQPDGPPIRDGLPYSRIAHLAEDVRPFVGVARHLRDIGLSAPEILAQDLDAGLLLLEDLGSDNVYGDELTRGADQLELWREAVDVLLAMRRHPTPLPARFAVAPGILHEVPPHDRRSMQIEVELLVDWYVPAVTGHAVDAAARSAFLAAWDGVFDRLLAMPKTLVLRDFHSPNLLRLADREGVAGTGVIDFQDALIGHASYDLVSLLQDARVDVAAGIERRLLDHYLGAAAAAEPGFDAADFEFAYRALGAQRNTKILGIFVRLAMRDGKPRYLQHIPRIWRYLALDLQHSGLTDLRAWYDRELPVERRVVLPAP